MTGPLQGVDSMAAERGGVVGIVTLTVMMANSSVAKKAQLGFRPWNPPTGSVADDDVRSRANSAPPLPNIPCSNSEFCGSVGSSLISILLDPSMKVKFISSHAPSLAMKIGPNGLGFWAVSNDMCLGITQKEAICCRVVGGKYSENSSHFQPLSLSQCSATFVECSLGGIGFSANSLNGWDPTHTWLQNMVLFQSATALAIPFLNVGNCSTIPFHVDEEVPRAEAYWRSYAPLQYLSRSMRAHKVPEDVSVPSRKFACWKLEGLPKGKFMSPFIRQEPLKVVEILASSIHFATTMVSLFKGFSFIEIARQHPRLVGSIRQVAQLIPKFFSTM
ncbi:hypothetical protein Cgig2_020655 [Carnegiea gigantea]|uniref:Uncharacterized protein n=1 Tax=Carnegiea gigantea TaxID=171969 RepID=A0A9Q1KIR0_9CARY|nr:hypothetical protein Cgig2_020655 [Carnegiea gigantea]